MGSDPGTSARGAGYGEGDGDGDGAGDTGGEGAGLGTAGVSETSGVNGSRAAWVGLAENVARAAGDESAEVQTSHEELSDEELHIVNEWASTLSAQLSRNATSSGRD